MSKYNLPFPRVVRIEPSSLCNLKCRHCSTGTVDMQRGLMSKETFSLIVKNIEDNIDNVKVVVLYHGGEPFLNKDFGYMLKTIKNLKNPPFVKTTSNGMLLTEILMEEIIENKLDNIYFSIDGQSPEENNFIRRNSDYHIIVKNIKKLIELKKQYNSTTPKIIVSNVQFVKEIDKSTKITEDLIIPVSSFLLEEFEEEYKNGEMSFYSLYPYVWPGINLDAELFSIQEFDDEPSNYCDQIVNTLKIRWNGDVTVCCYDLTSKYVVGNIYNDNLSTIWNNEKYVKIRESIDNYKFFDLCKDCIAVSSVKKALIKNNVW